MNMKLKYFIILAVLIGVASIGYAYMTMKREPVSISVPVENTKESEGTTPNNQVENKIIGTVRPSSDGGNEYTSTVLGFQVSMPSGVNVEKETNTSNNRLVTFVHKNFKYEVRIRKSNNITLENYHYLDIVSSENTTIDGYKAKVYKSTKGICEGPSCTQPFIAYALMFNNDFYHLIFYGDTTLSPVETKILSAFKILE
jgi:hypothetical protein